MSLITRDIGRNEDGTSSRAQIGDARPNLRTSLFATVINLSIPIRFGISVMNPQIQSNHIIKVRVSNSKVKNKLNLPLNASSMLIFTYYKKLFMTLKFVTLRYTL